MEPAVEGSWEGNGGIEWTSRAVARGKASWQATAAVRGPAERRATPNHHAHSPRLSRCTPRQAGRERTDKAGREHTGRQEKTAAAARMPAGHVAVKS